MSPHHFTRNTVSATFWCNKCSKPTMHRVDGGRRGPCMVCMEAIPHGDRRPVQIEQAALFSEPLARDRRGD